MDKNKAITHSAIAFSFVFILIILFIKEKEESSIKRNMKISSAIVKEAIPGYRGGIQIEYAFDFEGKDYGGNTKILISSSFRNDFFNKSFPVVFDSMNPRRNYLLIMPSDFKEYNLQYPDSLQWILILREKSL